MKKRRLDANEPLNAEFEKFQQHFHQVVVEIAENYNLCLQTVTGMTYPTLPRNHSRCSSYSHSSSFDPGQCGKTFLCSEKIKSDLRASVKANIADATLLLETYEWVSVLLSYKSNRSHFEVELWCFSSQYYSMSSSAVLLHLLCIKKSVLTDS